MKTTIATICSTLLLAAPACATPITVNGGDGGSSRNSSSINNEINYPQNIPDMVGPVPRGYVPVLSFYGQLDYQQRGAVGAQVSIPLAR